MVTLAEVRVPGAIDAVTAAWLSEVLQAGCTASKALTVRSFRVERIAQDTGFSSLLYRLHLTGDGDVPSTVIVKLPAQSEARWAMDLLGGYRRELSFYRHVAGRAPIATPQVICRWNGAGLSGFRAGPRRSAGLGECRPSRRAVDASGSAVHRAAGWSARLVGHRRRRPLRSKSFRASTRRSFVKSCYPAFEFGLARLPRPVPLCRFRPR